MDACTECGFCEAVCPSRRFTLTPRQRILIERERARLLQQGVSAEQLQTFDVAYDFEVLDSCATDSLCALACPVGIDTGQFVKAQRAKQISASEQSQMQALSMRFKQLEIGMKLALGAGKIGQKLLGNRALAAMLRQADKVLPLALPHWHGNYPPPNLKSLPSSNAQTAQYIYFPSCLSRNMGYAGRPDLPHTLVRLAKRAKIDVFVPPQSTGLCCGLPFSSKGYQQAGEAMRTKTLEALAEVANGRPVIVDTSPCTHYLQQANSDLYLMDSVAFLRELAPNLPLVPRHARVILHPVCSLRHMGLEADLIELAERCAQEVIVPEHSGCCAYAGDRGLMIPELPEAALADTRKELDALPEPATEGKTFYCSSSRSCEMGLSMSLERDYISIVYLLANSLVWQRERHG